MSVGSVVLHRGYLWTGVVLLTLAHGAFTSEETSGPMSSEVADSALLALFRNMYERELVKQMMQQQLHQQPSEDLERPESLQQYEPMPLPLALHVGDVSRESDKRSGSSYNLTACPYKMCPPGRRKKFSFGFEN